MKYCPECGTKLSGTKFCPECGYDLRELSETAPQEKLQEVASKVDFDFSELGQLVADCMALEETQQQNSMLASFETERHQNGKYAILALKNKAEMMITVPENVEAIGPGAFEGSRVMQVVLPEGLLLIDDRAFADCIHLESIHLPASLRIIGKEAFAGCTHLYAEVPANVRVDTDAFRGTVTEQKQIEEENRKSQEEESQRKERALQYFTQGENYYYGDNDIEVNYDEAVKWYREAAELDYVGAQYRLAQCYFYGYGVTKDTEKAKTMWLEVVKTCEKAVSQGDAEAQFWLGECYYGGNGVDRDNTKAVAWYRRAADQGHAEAQYSLGYCYYYGFGVPENETEAIQWFRKAAEQGHPYAISLLEDSGNE